MVSKKSIPMTLLLIFVSCGLYYLYLFYVLSSDTNDLTNEYKNNPAMDLILTIVTCGLYQIFWFYKIGRQIENLEFDLGMRVNSISLLCTILSLIPSGGIVSMIILISEMNNCIDEKECI